jgi:hypothetical protein
MRGSGRKQQSQLPAVHSKFLAPWATPSVSVDASGHSKRLHTATVPVANVCVGLCVQVHCGHQSPSKKCNGSP